MIMTKFQKRLSKLTRQPLNCLVMGHGFGLLQDISQIYKTVFVIDKRRPDLKVKNLVYRENADDLSCMTELSVIFFDLSATDKLSSIVNLAARCNSLVIIEGNDPIGREISGPLYHYNYHCTSLQNLFHVWELK